jgi:hypothetical protein
MTSIKRDTLSRRQILPLLGGAAVIAAGVRHPAAAEPSDAARPGAKARFVYVGTYTFPAPPRVEPIKARPMVFMCSG